MGDPKHRNAEEYDAVVIGGGPSGSVAGLRLAEAGWRVAIIERASFPRRKVCGEFLSATNWRLLRRLGVWDRFRSESGPAVERVALFDGAKRPVTAPLPAVGAGLDDGLGWGRALTRDRLDTLLLDEAIRRGASVFQPARCVGIERTAGRWRCRVAGRLGETDGEQSLDTPVVIAAHGAWMRGSLPTLPPHAPASGRDLLGFKAHFTGADLPPDLMPLLAFPGGYGGMVTCQAGRVSISCCVRRRLLERLRKRYSATAGDALLAHLRDSIPSVRSALRDAERQGDWLAAGPIRPGRRRPFRDGVLAVGNAAGEAHSVVAEGISMAMQSAWLAADCLLDATGGTCPASAEQVATAGQRYERLWADAFASRIRVASLVAGWAMRPTLVRLSGPVVRRWPAVLTTAARLAGKSRQVVAEEGPQRSGSALGGAAVPGGAA